jgi:ABC-type transport system involved in cytochrome c biogenesis permease subunit
MVSLGVVWALLGEVVSRVFFRMHLRASEAALMPEAAVAASEVPAYASTHASGGVATIVKPTVDQIRAIDAANRPRLDTRAQMMQETAAKIKPLSTFIYRSMQVGVLLIAAGTILGGVWADYSWGRFWGWDPKEVWALITLLVYLVPLHGRFAGWVNTFGLVIASVVCFLSVIMAWYGVNFVLGVGLHSYGFVEAGYQGAMCIIIAGVMSFPIGAYWRRKLTYLTP